MAIQNVSSPTCKLAPAASSDRRVELSRQKWEPSLHELLVMLTLATLSLMVALDACVIVTLLNTLVSDLDLDTTQGFWLGTAYLLANAVAMPFIAALSDSFGRQVCVGASLVCFTAGSLLGGLAHGIISLLIGRCLQGIGGAGIIVLSLVIFTDIVPLRFRPKWYGTVLGAWALGNCAGPIIGGAIAQNVTWRWMFYLMLPFCGVGVLLTPCLVTLRVKPATTGERLRRVDWLGGFSLIVSVALFLVAISWGGIQYPWQSVSTLLPLCFGCAGIAWTLIYETRIAQEPFLHRGLFWGASPIATYACGAIQGLVIYGQLYYVPFYFLAVKGYTPVRTGLAIFPVMFTLVPGSIVTGLLVTRTNDYRYLIWAGWSLTTISSGLMLMWDVVTPATVWAVTLIILGFGHGAILNAQNFATQAMCEPGEEGRAAAMYAFLRQFGMAVGVGVGGTTFQNIMALRLGQKGLPLDIAAQSEGFIAKLRQLPDDNALKVGVLNAYVFGFRGVYALYMGVSGIALLLSLLIRRFDMNKAIDTEQRLQEVAILRG